MSIYKKSFTSYYVMCDKCSDRSDEYSGIAIARQQCLKDGWKEMDLDSEKHVVDREWLCPKCKQKLEDHK